ncbi:MAG TPA: hypothetical protein IAC65_06275 [Candidatus Aphodousia faecipullorum]|nr:hypothetical protein [Candidatus Aphodousia faecipullorum]
MAQDFDYFLILSALAFFMVVILIIRMTRGNRANKTDETKIGATQTPLRRERIRPNRQPNFEIPKNLLKPEDKAPRLARIELYDACQKLYAVLRRSDLSAQAWGRGEAFSENLDRFAAEYLPLSKDEALMLHIVDPTLRGALTAKGFDENNHPWEKSFQKVPNVDAFPQVNTADDFSAWLKNQLASDCSAIFFELPEAAQAALMLGKSEDLAFTQPFDKKTNAQLLSYQAYRLLNEIVNHKNFYERSALWNRYFKLKSSNPDFNLLVNPNDERLVISHSFALTQKLPIFYIRDTKDCGKWHNALNF